MKLNRKTRRGLIDWQRYQLFLPRVQMTVILALTGLAGFFTSFLLLHSGLTPMWLRYPIAILVAYGAFLVFLRIWLAFHGMEITADLYPAIDVPTDLGSVGPGSPGVDLSVGGGGGDFGGGGAGGSWGDGASSPVAFSSGGSSSGGGSAIGSVGGDLDFEELWLLVLAVIALIGGLIATFYIIYIAPALLAEILVDGLLLRSLHKRVRDADRQNWLRTAIRKTWLPALLCALCFGVAGAALQAAVPEAKSIGEVWSIVTKKDR